MVANQEQAKGLAYPVAGVGTGIREAAQAEAPAMVEAADEGVEPAEKANAADS